MPPSKGNTNAAETETGRILYQLCDALAVCPLTCVDLDDQD